MEGQHVLEHALSHLNGTASPRLEQLIARARGVLADPAEARVHFDKGLRDPAGDQWPFERAQLRLDHGEWLRRSRRINDAKPVLAQALGIFRRLGALSWAQRAAAELRACGVAGADAPAERDALSELTPQQRQIVRLASDGLTNRQIADRLFLSPRTVSSHLYRSYPKLGVAGLDQGESLGGLLSQGPVTPALAHLFNDKHGFSWLSEDDFVNHFAADVNPVRAKVMYAVQQPLATSAFGDMMGVPAWKTLPSWYLVAADDEALPPDAERMFASRMGATTVETPSSHVAMVSHPGDVAQLIKAAAEAAPAAS